MNNLMDILFTVLVVDVAVISMFLIKLLKTKLSSEEVENLKKWVKIGVETAEMLFPNGIDKKNYVIEFLEKKGINAGSAEVNNLIEAVVQELKKGGTNND